MAKLCLIGVVLTFFVHADSLAGSDPLWDPAIPLLQEGKGEEAIPLLESWLTQAEAKGIRSPEAHHNLAVAYSQTERWAPAVVHLLTSASLRANPLYRAEAARSVSRVQNRLLIQDAVSSRWPFRLALFLPVTLLWVLGISAFWIGAFSLLTPQTRRPLLLASALLFLATGAAAAVRCVLPRFAVIQATSEGTALMSDKGEGAKKLVDLPAGTLVAYKESGMGTTFVTRPFAGWVSSSALQPVLEP